MKQYTPMMQQYLSVKANYPDTLVFYRLGDFYEMFFEDAKIAAYELDLVLTGRQAGVKERVPMCGVPYHAVDTYLLRLVNKGYKIAIVEQLEDPASAVGIVKRDVVRVITPGTVFEDFNHDNQSVFIAALTTLASGYACVYGELIQGSLNFKIIGFELSDLLEFVLSHNIKELVVDQAVKNNLTPLLQHLNIALSTEENEFIPAEYQKLSDLVKDDQHKRALGRLLNYLTATQKRNLVDLFTIEINQAEYLELDYATVNNLELVATLKDKSKVNTLWDYLDQTQSAYGSRLLREWVLRPLARKEAIEKRQTAISTLVENRLVRANLKLALRSIYDLPRILTKAVYETINALDLKRLEKTLAVVPTIYELCKSIPYQLKLNEPEKFQSLQNELEQALVTELPAHMREGGFIQAGYHLELDHLRTLKQNASQYLLELEQKERDKTGIKNLKIGYNRVYGYYFEVSKGNLNLIKPEYNYLRKQTLVNAERFVNEDLSKFEAEALAAQEQALALELELFQQLVEKIKQQLTPLQNLAHDLAEIDILVSLAEVSDQANFVKPSFTEQRSIKVIKGRHPMLAKLLEQKYVENDWIFSPLDQVMVLTGPNMGGKTTYMRQNALIVIMAQLGCYVPALECELPIFDQIFTRMGASDDILGGRSTFMVEMSEANTALSRATQHSLVLFDEIGRGTSTYDGMALAQAMIEYLANHLQATTIFSTHYHELTELEKLISGVINYHVLVLEAAEKITFLYQIKRGVINRSYGLHVATLAGLPEVVTKRAQAILAVLVKAPTTLPIVNEVIEIIKIPANYQAVMNQLKLVDINQLTPLAALEKLAQLKQESENE